MGPHLTDRIVKLELNVLPPSVDEIKASDGGAGAGAGTGGANASVSSWGGADSLTLEHSDELHRASTKSTNDSGPRNSRRRMCNVSKLGQVYERGRERRAV